jgi:hypothetical protein
MNRSDPPVVSPFEIAAVAKPPAELPPGERAPLVVPPAEVVDADGPAPMAAPSKHERRALLAAFVTYALVQINAILHHGTWGQDFVGHLIFVARAYRDPWKFATTFAEGQNNPPLFHMLVAGIFWLTGHVHALEVMSFITMLLNAGAIFLLYRLSLRVAPRAPLVRVAATVFLLFLPAGMIHGIVLAADCLATPATVLVMYTLVRVAEAGRGRLGPFLLWCGAALLALFFAVSIKYTAVSLVPAAVVSLVAMWFARAAGTVRTVVALVLVVGAPAAHAARMYVNYRAQQKSDLGVSMKMDPFTSEMNVRDVVFLRPADGELLDAPAYNKPSDPKDPNAPLLLAIHNRHSYLGLLHLAVFTDILNVYQYDPLDGYFGPRSKGNQRRMSLAVKTALAFSVPAAAVVPCVLVASAWGCLVRRRREKLLLLIVLTVSFAFFGIIVVFLPFTGSLGGGYWLPRLIVPALFGFFFTLFAWVGRTRFGASPVGGALVLGAVLFQTGLSTSFMLPWGISKNEHPVLADMVSSDLAVDAELEVRFAKLPPGSNDPLVVIGKYGVADLYFAHYGADGTARIAYNRWGLPTVPKSEPFEVDPSVTHKVRVVTDPDAATVVVYLDGREVLRLTDTLPLPTYRDNVHLAHNPTGGVVSERFSGQVLSKKAKVKGGKRWGPAAPAPR